MRFSKDYSLEQISELMGAPKFVGSPDFVVKGINEIHMVEKGDLTFVDHPKYYDKALNSKATTILINKEVDCPEGKALIISDQPFDDYMKLVKYFRPFEAAQAMISPTAKIGKNTVVQPGAFIGNNVTIGKNCIIHANVSIYDHSVIGDDVIIHSAAVIGADAYYFQKRPEGFKKFESCGRVIIGDKVEIGAHCAIDKGVSGDTTIDTDTKLDNHCQIGHDTYIGKHCLIGAHAAIAGVTRIEDDVIVWGRVAINKDIVIGKGAVILATSAVDKTLEGGKTYFGVPAIEARDKWKEMAVLRRLAAEKL
ncbi:MAG: UDP-3-O-(3-hydroxymyristoyl)glucosamine N-acyltransferase [Bacteroidetes bacterium 4572_77]|nr:MAG: UDP-3-O-(3-hydroxymyristoyl)glucosamine N-acyltransferase [Bacteroidetes bacterium 4572_77]